MGQNDPFEPVPNQAKPGIKKAGVAPAFCSRFFAVSLGL